MVVDSVAKSLLPAAKGASLLKILCSWCGRDMGDKPGPSDQVTHGICTECLRRELSKLKPQGVRMEAAETVGRVFYAMCLLSDAHEELEQERLESGIEYIDKAKAHLVAVVDAAGPALMVEVTEWIRTLDLGLAAARDRELVELERKRTPKPR